MEALAQLSKDTQDSIFLNILNVLGNREALQDLMDMVRGSSNDLGLIRTVKGAGLGNMATKIHGGGSNARGKGHPNVSHPGHWPQAQ